MLKRAHSSVCLSSAGKVTTIFTWNNLEINQLVDIYYEFDPYDKLYINILDKNNANINKNINLVIIYFNNEINLKDFNIIDNFENCYYIKKKW